MHNGIGKLTQFLVVNVGISLLVFAYLQGYANVDPQLVSFQIHKI
jgi:hypothetical protein